MFLIPACSCLCAIYWRQVLSEEWRCSWSSTNRWCSNYIWVINNSIAYLSASYVRDLMVVNIGNSLVPSATIHIDPDLCHQMLSFDQNELQFDFIMMDSTKEEITLYNLSYSMLLKSSKHHVMMSKCMMDSSTEIFSLCTIWCPHLKTA